MATCTDCQSACDALFDCGLAKCGTGGAQLCPKFGPGMLTQAMFVGTAMSGGCLQQCMQFTALASQVNPTDCEATVTTFTTLSTSFKSACGD